MPNPAWASLHAIKALAQELQQVPSEERTPAHMDVLAIFNNGVDVEWVEFKTFMCLVRKQKAHSVSLPK